MGRCLWENGRSEAPPLVPAAPLRSRLRLAAALELSTRVRCLSECQTGGEHARKERGWRGFLLLRNPTALSGRTGDEPPIRVGGGLADARGPRRSVRRALQFEANADRRSSARLRAPARADRRFQPQFPDAVFDPRFGAEDDLEEVFIRRDWKRLESSLLDVAVPDLLLVTLPVTCVTVSRCMNAGRSPSSFVSLG